MFFSSYFDQNAEWKILYGRKMAATEQSQRTRTLECFNIVPFWSHRDRITARRVSWAMATLPR